MTYGSLFSGIGGMDLGFDDYAECKFQVEIDKKCQSILARHWPNTAKYTDVQQVNGALVDPVDIITFGSPCQDLSVAGRRAGLAGERSGLFYEAMRIIKEMRDATGNQYPKWVVWENVPGALTSNNGHDFAAVLDSMAETGALVQEWSILDAQFFGVPQRRRRLFLIACFDPAISARCPSPLLPVSKDLPGHINPKRAPRKKASRTTQDGSPELNSDVSEPADGSGRVVFSKSKRAQTAYDDESWINSGVTPTLNAFDQSESRSTVLTVEQTWWDGSDMTPCLDSSMLYKQQTMPDKGRMAAVITPMGFNWANGGGYNNANPGLGITVDGTGPLSTSQVPAVAYVNRVRRLTPLECERLMGFPDDHTKFDSNGKQQADTPRYKQCGNAVASPVARWIAKQISLTHFA